MLAILIWLGTWQYQRLQWKTALLEEVEQSVTAPPLRSFTEIVTVIEDGKPVDYRRVQIDAELLAFDRPFRVYTGENRDVSWRIYTPVRNDGVTAFAAMDVISDTLTVPVIQPGTDNLAGYIRLARADNNPRVKSTPAENRWFGFNPLPDEHNWAESVKGGVDMRFYIDVVIGAKEAQNLPAKRPQIRNNHFDYMLTWYGLAVTLLVIYTILHIKEGRLSWRSSDREPKL